MDEKEADKSRLFDLYTLVLICILLCNVILNAFIIHQYIHSFVYLALLAVMTSTLFWPNKIRFDKRALTLLFVSSGIICFFYSSCYGEKSMIYVSYIPVILLLPFFFDIRKDQWWLGFIITTYIVEFSINVVTDYSLFSNFSSIVEEDQVSIRIYKIIEIIIWIFINLYFMYMKEEKLKEYYNQKHKIENLLNEINQEENVKVETLEELYQLAMNRNPSFLTKFRTHYPVFFNKLTEKTVSASGFVAAELEVCALLKLNFTTKEIAQATNSTVRAVEGKKYRIRKKLSVPSEIDLNIFMNNI